MKLAHTSGRHRLPAVACRFRNEAIRLELAPATEKGKARTFRIVGNTGKKMLRVGYWGPLAFDFAGLSFKQQLPCLLDHDPRQRVGFSESVKVGDEGMVFEGRLLQQNEHVQAVLRDADDGYPWQASIMVEPTKAQYLTDGEVTECNGEQVEGPCYVIREGVVREVSFVALGADDDASAEVAASGADSPSVTCDFLNEAHMPAPKTTENDTSNDKPAGNGAANNTARTAADVRREFPVQVAELQAAAVAPAVQAALESERERASKILEHATEDQNTLASKLIKDGTDATSALSALLKDANAKRAAAASDTLDGEQTTKPAAAGNTGADAELDPQGTLRASFPKDERGEKAYQAFLRNQRTKV